MSCLSEEQLFLLVDGGVAPNRAEPLERHLAGCADCARERRALLELVGDLRAAPEEVERLHEDAHVARVMARVTDGRRARETATPPRTLPRREALGWAAGAVALAAGALLALRTPDARGPREAGDDAFTARGGPSEASLRRDVGVRIYAIEALEGAGSPATPPVALRDGATVGVAATFTGGYTNLGKAPAYALVFALDAAGEVHWLYPAYEDARFDPSSVALPRALRERLLPTSVALDAPAPGPLRIVSVTTRAPLRVSDIEGRPPGALSRDALAAAFPDANVTEIRVVLEPREIP